MRRVQVIASVAFKLFFEALSDECRSQREISLAPVFLPSVPALKVLLSGDDCDVLIVSEAAVPRFTDAKLLDVSTIAPLARSLIGVAIRKGAPRPPLRTVDDFLAIVESARSIAYTDPKIGTTSGVQFADILKKFGLEQAVRAKAVLGDGGPVSHFVGNGLADVAIQQLSELVQDEGVEIVGALPEPIQKETAFVVARAAGSKNPEAASAFIDLILEPASQNLLVKFGLQPHRAP